MCKRQLLIGLPLLFFVGPAAAADWPMWGGNSQRTGVAEGGLTPPYIVKWSFDRSGKQNLGTSPVIADGVLYQGDRLGGLPWTIWALNAQTGFLNWSLPKTYWILGPQWLNGNLYYGHGEEITPDVNNFVESLDTATQIVNWSVPTEWSSLVFATPSVTYVMAQSSPIVSGTVYAIDNTTGSVNWTLEMPGGSPQGPMAYDNGVLYIPAEPVMAVVDQGGSPLVQWAGSIPCGNQGPPVVANGRIYTGCGTSVYVHDQASGTFVWSYAATSAVRAVSVFGNKVLFPSDGFLYCVEDTGSAPNFLWKTDVDVPPKGVGQPVIANNFVYINGKDAAFNRAIHALDLDGNVVWTFAFSGAVLSSPAVANNLLYYSPNGEIYCFGKPLNLSLEVDQAQANPSDTVIYTLTVNSYNGPSTDVTLVATLPAQLVYQSSSDSGVLMTGNLVVWNTLSITADTIKTLTITAQVDPALSGGTYDLVVQGFLDYAASPANLTESLSEKTHTLVVLPSPAPPSNLTAIGKSTTIQLAWDIATSGVDPISGYNVYRATFSGFTAAPGTFLVQTVGLAATSYNDSSVTTGISYCYLVRAVDGNSVESVDSNEACASLVVSLPGPPTNLTALPGQTTIGLSWVASVPGTDVISGYNLYRATFSGFIVSSGTFLIQVLGATTTTFSDTGVIKGVMYCYRIRAVDVNGLSSGDSNEACATLPLPPPPYRGPVRVFPNPYNPATAVRGTVKFEGLSVGTKVRLYTPRGLKVWEGEVVTPYLVEWDGRGGGGRRVAPGTYIWRAEGDGENVHGTLIVE